MTFSVKSCFCYHGNVNLKNKKQKKTTKKTVYLLYSICVNQVLIIHNLNELLTVINVFLSL